MIDLNSFVGAWPSHVVEGQAEVVWGQLRSLGVNQIFVSPLESCWGRNPHAFNSPLYEKAFQVSDVWPVPVLDPTVETWAKELDRAVLQHQVELVRLLPNYHGYNLADVEGFLAAVHASGLGVVVQVCMEDSRRHHPLAVVPNVPIADVFAIAEKMPEMKMVIGGGKAGEVRAMKDRVSDLPNLYFDTAQVDGLDAVKVLVDDGMGLQLVFGSHAPLLVPHAAITRIVTDLDDETALAILEGNAQRLLGETLTV